MLHSSLKSLFGAVLLTILLAFQANAQDGAKLFKQNCAVCHFSHTDQKLTGPGLKGVFDRVPKPAEKWLHSWILNNEKMIKSGDAYAKQVYAANGNAAMTVFEGQLSDADVDQIIKFIQSPPPVVAAKSADAAGPAAGADEDAGAGIDPLYLILGSIVLLAIMIGALRSVRSSLKNNIERQHGEPESEELTFWQEIRQWMGKNTRLVGVFCIIIACIGMKSCWNACYNIGVYYNWQTGKGYKPEQPIKFSHKIHAGDNEIACQYCHNSVEKSRHAGIPTVNVCMNCHKGIQEGPTTGKTEIAKIYAASGFDPSKGTYDVSKANPIKWIKVHNLPDHVYFNHSQHVVVGKLECAQCHGDLKSMTVAEQKVPLTMKWCIECHRKTEVAMEGNAYYDRLHAALKAKYKGQYDVKFTVDKIGGIECAKCHY